MTWSVEGGYLVGACMRFGRRSVAHALFCGWVALLTVEAAAEPDARVELTDAASALYNFDNRDTRRGQVGSVANDHFGLLYNRLNLQAASGKFTLSLRGDSAWFFASPSPADIADELGRREPGQSEDYRLRKLTEAGLELSNRFINWSYPAKYSLTWGTPDLELTLGDSYAQLGRGIVLSARKLDELASDTTVRGARAQARFRRGELRLKLTLLGGSLNPLRIDEASGRYLGVQGDVTRGFLRATEAFMPRAIATDFAPLGPDCLHSSTCSFAPDHVVAGQIELSVPKAIFATQASLLGREAALTEDTSRKASSILTASQSVDVPRLFEHGSGYFEAALQKLSGSTENSLPDLGYALYGAVNWIEPRFSLTAEGKHYRRLFPLSANVSASRAREFALLAYSAPPTTEELWSDSQFGRFNTCVSGGRLKGEAHATRSHSVFAWLGHYRSYSESTGNDSCDTSPSFENRIWDGAVGVNAHPLSRPARYQVLLGSRFDDAGRSLSGVTGPTEVFYRELYVRYALSEPLGGPFTLELQGFHRRRRESVGGPSDRWFEGQHSTALDIGEHLSAAIGVEYDTRPGTPLGYVNAMLSYRPSSALSFSLFAGQRRGALRCVGGVCRVYPAFEGVRLDATLRY
ncbi:MAG: hypothetical protein QM756_17730 [Polyangiaceae bacterium]